MSGRKTGSDILARCHWVFDLDGTLTLPVHDFALIRTTLAVPDGADILGHVGTLPDEEASIFNARLEVMERELVTRAGAAPGAEELVKLLVGRRCRLGILTRNSRDIAQLTLEHIGFASCFHRDEIIGRDEALPKPDPDGIRRLARLWGVAPHELVMVGDYLYDLQAGRAAGAATIHVHGDFERRWPEWTDICVVSLKELTERVHASPPPTL
jgi:HAD superfamily hydrolase (TIGR01509 family)